MDEVEQAKKTLGCMGFMGTLVLVLLFVLGGSHRTEITYQLGPGQQVGNFSETVTASHWLMGLKQGKPVATRDLINKHLREGEKLTELTVIFRHTARDLILTGITLGIYCPVTVEIRGTVGK